MSYAQAYYGGAGVITGAATGVLSGSIHAAKGEEKIVTIQCNQAVESLTLGVLIETLRAEDVAVVHSNEITNSAMQAEFALPEVATSVERTMRWSVYRTDTEEVVAYGLLFVTTKALED